MIGVPIPTLRWYRDGKPLEPGSALTIRAFSKESKSYMGLFSCEAENCMGKFFLENQLLSVIDWTSQYNNSKLNYCLKIVILSMIFTGSNTTYSRVYAKNFAEYLKQVGHLNHPSPTPKSASTLAVKNKSQGKPSKNSKTSSIKNSQVSEIKPTNGNNNNIKPTEKSDEDSGIVDDTHHI